MTTHLVEPLHGFLNPALYGRVRDGGGLRDIDHVNGATARVDFRNRIDASNGTVTTVRTFDFPGLAIDTRPGYDLTTGLGAPDGVAFLLSL